MWNKVSLRMRLTILMAIALAILCILLRGVAIYSAGEIFFEPYEKIFVSQQTGVQDETQDLIAYFGESQHEFVRQLNGYTFIIICLGSILTWFVAGKSLKPITHLSQAIEVINENNLQVKLEEQSGNDEIARLTSSFNDMLSKLKNAFESQKRFSNNAAHELKTPIAAMITNIEVLEMSEEPCIEEYKEVIEVAKEQTERMNTLVQDLQSLNLGLTQMTGEAFMTLPMFQEIVKDYARQIQDKNIQLSIQGDVKLVGDESLLKRGFANIVQNAIRYNKTDGIIRINCSEGEISIADTGMGIPKEHIDKVFEPFYCVDTSRSRAFGGSGLGLCIAKQIFEKQMMNIRVESNKGGTTFYIDF